MVTYVARLSDQELVSFMLGRNMQDYHFLPCLNTCLGELIREPGIELRNGRLNSAIQHLFMQTAENIRSWAQKMGAENQAGSCRILGSKVEQTLSKHTMITYPSSF
ncbi:hypothetical protein PGT21_022611 [Puccinia graminis f. sp. tritici]|uniref:Uncharacterized protein n=1 Tax=Puccinia graminis f. sp. tritici TaxID=56615 RepID=A0A5B0QB04_PUCGR|nr:hypothetical protein PGT21_022611 [Puccinia graminis f. sp. tritici]